MFKNLLIINNDNNKCLQYTCHLMARDITQFALIYSNANSFSINYVTLKHQRLFSFSKTDIIPTRNSIYRRKNNK